MECEHSFVWIETKVRGFAQCTKCSVIRTEVTEAECVGYVPKEVTMAQQKAKKARDLEKRRSATIAYLKSKGLTTTHE